MTLYDWQRRGRKLVPSKKGKLTKSESRKSVTLFGETKKTVLLEMLRLGFLTGTALKDAEKIKGGDERWPS